jgi:hypothetical protein
MEAGMDTCWANAQPQYGRIPADPNIVALVDAFAQMDGASDKQQQAAAALEKFCAAGRKPGPKPQKEGPKTIPITPKSTSAPAHVAQTATKV